MRPRGVRRAGGAVGEGGNELEDGLEDELEAEKEEAGTSFSG